MHGLYLNIIIFAIFVRRDIRLAVLHHLLETQLAFMKQNKY